MQNWAFVGILLFRGRGWYGIVFYGVGQRSLCSRKQGLVQSDMLAVDVGRTHSGTVLVDPLSTRKESGSLCFM